ncbi:hypothetical protein BSKO_07460 [Bryopsis sp. KO-2023]|nr:hypothetical protein BSKO_07460 [Bryopsis sp. KO-2023]
MSNPLGGAVPSRRRRTIQELMRESTLLGTECARSAALDDNIRIIKERMTLAFKQSGAVGCVILFPKDRKSPFLFCHSRLRDAFGEDQMRKLSACVDEALLKERKVRSSNDFKTSSLRFKVKQVVCAVWMQFIKYKEKLPDYKDMGGKWPQTVDWSPEGVPYQSPSKMKSTDATAEGAWIDVLLQTIVQHVPKDELKTILETGRLPLWVTHEEIVACCQIVEVLAPQCAPPLKEPKLTTASENTQHDESVRDAILKYWASNSVEVMTSVVDGVEIHLGKLKNVVEDLGGGDEVTTKKRWGQVADQFGIKKSCKNRGYRLKNIWVGEVEPAVDGASASMRSTELGPFEVEEQQEGQQDSRMSQENIHFQGPGIHQENVHFQGPGIHQENIHFQGPGIHQENIHFQGPGIQHNNVDQSAVDRWSQANQGWGVPSTIWLPARVPRQQDPPET